ncbi:tetratricopeptide repeat protein [Actinomadura latina]|uniref:TIR domain-containing protein n=1 Tax=Actinomadura latina TaxID=163603 RepID=A0A846Z3B6_9ACTN|nr:TIR domain-containing protein [Actinomadura latina]NKZ05274.1 TIR domain-containing protein [Actinomadura latina]
MAESGDFDVFMSLGGCDRPAVTRLVRAMRERGLRVFLDTDRIAHFEGVTATIESALNSSKALVAYYSAGYPSRPACQAELTAAFLAGQREGDPGRRIIVVNPEPDTGHIMPVELSDARFAVAPSGTRNTATLADLILDRVRGIDGRIGAVHFADRPRWYPGRVPGASRFVGRYRELWDLHTALFAADLALTQDRTLGPAAVVAGLPGSGRSALVAAYAWQFGAAFRGGVHWISLTGARTAADVRARYADAVRMIAGMLGLPAATASRELLLGMVADRLAEGSAPALWVVDDLPATLPDEEFQDLIIPAGTRVRTVATTDGEAYTGTAGLVRLDTMTRQDGRLLLSGGDVDADTAALDRIGAAAGWHARSLALHAEALRRLGGPGSAAGYAARVETDPPPAARLVAETIDALAPEQREILRLAGECAPAPLPTGVLSAAAGLSDEAVTAALADLGRRLLATRTGPHWQISPLARPAGHDRAMAHAAARAVLDRWDPAVLPHAAELADRTDLGPELLRRLAGHYTDTGDMATAARMLERLLPGDADLTRRAAAAFLLAGDAARARELAQECGADRIRAEALDAAGRLAESDVLWAALPADAARVRALRRRGRLAEAARLAEELLPGATAEEGADEAADEEIQELRLELARIQLAGNAQRRARRTAELVVRHYTRLGRSEHHRLIEARQILCEAKLTPEFSELRPDRAGWEEAEARLRDERDRYVREHGRAHPQALTASVAHAHALVAQGESGRACEELEAVLATVRSRLGARHPVYLRARFLLGQACAQQHEDERAGELFAAVLEGQRAVLGRAHPETLRTQQELAVIRKLQGDSAAAVELFAEVRRLSVHQVGRATDLHWQAFTGAVLSWLPSWMWRLGRS